MSNNDESRQYHQVPVHEDDLLLVYELLAERERERASTPAERSGGKAKPRIFLDSNLVIQMYRDSEERHRALLETLADAEGKWLYTVELAKALGVETGSKGMAGTFGAFGRRAKHRYKGLKPWDSEWEPIRDEACYRMKPEVAEWVKAAAEASGD
jgi:hypothetical protein